MKAVTPRWPPAAGRGVVLAALVGVLAGCGCAGLVTVVVWRIVDRAGTLP